MSQILTQLEQFVAQQPQIESWLVAYSGGLDSTLLLHAMAKLDVKLEAVHVHHGLSEHADDWQQHCRAVCVSLGVTLHCQSVAVVSAGRGLEDAAREARYAVFEQLLRPDQGLLLAHHSDDQAETLLLRLMRGSGTRGLSAMVSSRKLGQGHLYRPLLSFDRAQLLTQARSWQLAWIEDDSNNSSEFDRNFLRLKVFPELKQRWPQLTRRWARSADWCRQADGLVNEVAAEDLTRTQPRVERLGHSVELSSLETLSRYRRGNLLRHWFERLEVPLPDQAQLDAVEQQFMHLRADGAAQVQWGGVVLRHFKSRLYCLPKDWLDEVANNGPMDASLPLIESWRGAPLRWGGGLMYLEAVQQGGFQMPVDGFSVTLRRPGERCHPSWRNRSQTLKKLLQESQLEPWLRDQMPCLRSGDELVAAADLWHCHGWQAGDRNGYLLRWNLGSS